jgi:type IV pilus assembly protein PilE
MHINKKAFTLIELLIVVLIIGILAAIALPQYRKAVERSRFSSAFILGKSVKDAAERHYLAIGEYPSSLEDLDVTIQCPEIFTCGLRTGADASFAIGIKGGSLHLVFSFDKRSTKNGNIPLAGLIYCTALVGNKYANDVCKTYSADLFYTDTHNKYKIR